jgi:hypothetical protein
MVQNLLLVSFALFAGLLMTRLFVRFHLPDVTAYLVAGVLIGPCVLGRIGLGFTNFEEVDALSVINDVALGFKKLVRSDVVSTGTIFVHAHIALIELGEIILPRLVAGLQFLHGLFRNAEIACHGLQHLLVEQLHAQTLCQTGAYLMATSAELAIDGDDKSFLLIHKLWGFIRLIDVFLIRKYNHKNPNLQ